MEIQTKLLLVKKQRLALYHAKNDLLKTIDALDYELFKIKKQSSKKAHHLEC